jgi:hypothetical protein
MIDGAANILVRIFSVVIIGGVAGQRKGCSGIFIRIIFPRGPPIMYLLRTNVRREAKSKNKKKRVRYIIVMLRYVMVTLSVYIDVLKREFYFVLYKHINSQVFQL